MQRSVDRSPTVQWRPNDASVAAPTAACLVQAVLVSAAISVVFQSLVNLVADTPAVFLHVGCFLIVLPLVWKWQAGAHLWLARSDVYSCVSFCTQAIEGQLRSDGKVVCLRVIEVGRYWGALQLRLTPIDATPGSLVAAGMRKPAVITIWKSTIGQEKFRWLAILAIWHARRFA